MGMGLSFSDAFFCSEGESDYEPPAPSETPTTVAQALMSMPATEFREMCELIGVYADGECAISEVMEVIKATDWCDGAEVPVTVAIDENHDFTVTVYE
jgi:hypothetical protein